MEEGMVSVGRRERSGKWRRRVKGFAAAEGTFIYPWWPDSWRWQREEQGEEDGVVAFVVLLPIMAGKKWWKQRCCSLFCRIGAVGYFRVRREGKAEGGRAAWFAGEDEGEKRGRGCSG
ncbi:hypothetical protein HAX54_002880 [Datura stramonium]|uniref:Uncharacterized protein n=1 Tax=Datura stramonium TaxID=4076 RepID=A0ABS8WVG1_DATST|nr:hypothetical protein [Datura stramonium]